MLAFVAPLAQSVMLVTTQLQVGEKTGTGFVVSSSKSESEILTANHVIADGTAIFVYPIGPFGPRYQATLLGADPLRDAALLEVPVGGLTAVALGGPAAPVSGTKVEVIGYPAVGAPSGPASPGPNASPAAHATPAPAPTLAPLRLREMRIKTADGVVDGDTEQGEGILLNVAVTHGDSGAPVFDLASGDVVGMILGLAGGYGAGEWMSGDSLGVSVAGLQSMLVPIGPAPAPSPAQSSTPPPAPEFVVAFTPSKDPVLSLSYAQLGRSTGFAPAPSVVDASCTGPKGAMLANAVVAESGTPNDIELDVTDCSGATIFQDELTAENDDEAYLVRLVDRDFTGFVDTHRAEWLSLLRVGVFVDPTTNPYLSLMSVERNPFGQLIVGHTFHGGPADRAGVRPGDAVLKIDGNATRSLGDHFIGRLLNQPSVTLLLARQLREFTVRIEMKRYSQTTSAGPVPR